MNLIICSQDLSSYLEETEIINFRHPSVSKKIAEIQKTGKNKQEWAQLAFNFVRDEIQHSFDSDSTQITISASDALEYLEGICFAKAHLLAAMLRGMGIPTGFCYQRVTRKGTPDSGYALHGLNAIYFAEIDTWFRVDPRGNKPGVTSEFSITPEKLAYPIRTELDEIDYPYVYNKPLGKVVLSMEESIDCKELFFKRPELI
ncbi:transglutaminase family protein [Neobacillus sp. PS3-40]|uniref:transglutaminase-like domain-containing protein n=1 Tax=Neobacillus sp. PS3-40 TaxID=3070679 RepID=UPI0027DF3954|nr:transglutaminase family protein [Neobacillus sp. PS3-40]WML42858.1 transglutaminase family protein [Neobacillus sp. PS3-40]